MHPQFDGGNLGDHQSQMAQASSVAKGLRDVCDLAQSCHYCHGLVTGRMIAPILKSTSRHSGNGMSGFQGKYITAPVLFCSSISHCEESDYDSGQMGSYDFRPFISEGWLSM